MHDRMCTWSTIGEHGACECAGMNARKLGYVNILEATSTVPKFLIIFLFDCKHQGNLGTMDWAFRREGPVCHLGVYL